MIENNSYVMSENSKPKKTLWEIFKNILFNIIGFFSGYYLGYLAKLAGKFILFDLLGEFKLLTTILSWPVEYGTYALSGVIFIDAAVSLLSCAFICNFGKTKYNYACFALGVIRIISYIANTVVVIASDGFEFSAIWTIAICLIGFVYFTFNTASKKEF